MNQIGIVGMGVMGRSLALNLENKGYDVAVYNWTDDLTDEFIKEHSNKNITAYYDVEQFVNSLEKPRKILMMVKAGEATDNTINLLVPYLSKDDIIIDGGNTYFKDTIRRYDELAKKGIRFVGQGTSGGEEGALHGPSLMPGGDLEAYKELKPILENIAAKYSRDNQPCVTYIGPNGAGHYVKMVHNGIEYGDMQLISEIYDILRRGLKLPIEEISEIFNTWNQGELNSYLVEITANILKVKDDINPDQYLIDQILDKAGSKGTGKWTSQQALDLGEPVSVITEAVFARCMSNKKEERLEISSHLQGPKPMISIEQKDQLIEKIRKALYFGKVISYAQGFSQMQAASEEYNWNLQLGEIAKIFRAGCIIKAQFLQNITEAYEKNEQLTNLLYDDYFQKVVNDYQQDVRDILTLAIQNGIPTPSLASAISYYDSYRTTDLPANLIQAQRDYFGAHTFERKDKAGTFHHNWLNK